MEGYGPNAQLLGPLTGRGSPLPPAGRERQETETPINRWGSQSLPWRKTLETEKSPFSHPPTSLDSKYTCFRMLSAKILNLVTCIKSTRSMLTVRGDSRQHHSQVSKITRGPGILVNLVIFHQFWDPQYYWVVI